MTSMWAGFQPGLHLRQGRRDEMMEPPAPPPPPPPPPATGQEPTIIEEYGKLYVDDVSWSARWHFKIDADP